MNRHPPFKSHRLLGYIFAGIILGIVAFLVPGSAHRSVGSMSDLAPAILNSITVVVIMALSWEVILLVERAFQGLKSVVHDLIWMVLL